MNVEAEKIDDINDPKLPGKIQKYRVLISENLDLANEANSNRDSDNYLKYTCKIRKYSDEYIELLNFIQDSGIKIQELDKEKEVLIKKIKSLMMPYLKKQIIGSLILQMFVNKVIGTDI